MSNSRLYDKKYKVPKDIINSIKSYLIKYPTGDGVKRAKNIVKNEELSYSAMKRLKNFFDYFNSQSDSKIQYELAGGGKMKAYIETTLGSDRDSLKTQDDIRNMVGNIKKDVKLTTKAYKTPRLYETKVNRNSICILVDKHNRFLLVKRSNYENQWMPNKWALVGGKIEQDETPEKACVREIREELGIGITKILKRFVIQRGVDQIEYVFATRYDGKPNNIVLNKEHSKYGWFTFEEIYELENKVPNIMEYIIMSFKKYE